VKDGAHARQGGDLSTCYVNYNEPGIGHDLLKILDHNDVPYVLVEKEKCCGMPKLELGDLTSVDASKRGEHPGAGEVRPRGLRHPHAVPSCTLMFKQELPLMYPDDADVQRSRRPCGTRSSTWPRAGATACSRPNSAAAGQGQLPDALPLGRVQNIGKKTEEMLKMVPGTSVHTTSAARATPAPSA
jgi:glycerol-3-phosphate dehydrogenase subunit C